MFSSALRIHEHSELPTGYEPEPETALQVRAAFNGVLIGTRLLPETRRGGRPRHGVDPRTSYVIGESPAADAPAASDVIGARDLRLVSKWGGGFLVSVAPKMTGDVSVGGKVYGLADYVAGRGTSFALPRDARVRLQCGAMSFRLEPTAVAKQVPRRWLAWRWQEQKFTVGSVAAFLLMLLLAFAAPPDGATASVDLLGMSRVVIPFTVKPPVPEKAPEIAAAKPDGQPGNAGKAAAGPSGRMGDPNASRQNGRHAVRGNGIDMHLGKAEAAALARNAGFLGVLNSAAASKLTNILGSGMAVGDASEDVLANLVGNEVANAYGPGGLGAVGTGTYGGGFGEKTLGTGRFGTWGRGGDGHEGYGQGPAGRLAQREHIVPTFVPGIPRVRGSLDKEIIRRVVRLHMNEVKYCYDKELTTKPGLEGRVSVQFLISPNGQVLSSFLQSSSMGNVRVEKCVVDAIKRWEFPKPDQGGVAIVSYPFSFVASAGS